MAEEQAPEVTPRPKSVLPKLLLLGLVMLLVAAAVNLKDLRAIAAGEKTVKSVLYGKNLVPMGPTFAFPAPLGPEDAKVRAQVVCQEGNSCHEPLVALWMAVAKLEPERVRVEFRGSLTPPEQGDAPPTKPAERGSAPPPDMGCASGVSLNGETKFEIGAGKAKRVIYLTGPTPAPTEMAGTDPSAEGPGGHGWTIEDVATILNQRIKRAYKAEGKLTAEALSAAMQEASEEIPRPDETKGGEAAPH